MLWGHNICCFSFWVWVLLRCSSTSVEVHMQHFYILYAVHAGQLSSNHFTRARSFQLAQFGLFWPWVKLITEPFPSNPTFRTHCGFIHLPDWRCKTENENNVWKNTEKKKWREHSIQPEVSACSSFFSQMNGSWFSHFSAPKPSGSVRTPQSSSDKRDLSGIPNNRGDK